MPNWCDNVMTIRHKSKEKVLEVLNFIKNDEEKRVFDFCKVIAPTEEDKATYIVKDSYCAELNGTFNWHEWCIANWDTKWNADVYASTTEPVYDKHDEDWYAEIQFQTAWSPAVPVYRALCEKFPDVNISGHYNEPGNCFSGDWYGSDGEFSHDAYDYSDDEEEEDADDCIDLEQLEDEVEKAKQVLDECKGEEKKGEE